MNMRSRTLIATATALTFVLAGSAVAFADTGDASDHPDKTERISHLPDRHRDRPVDRPKELFVDRPTDHPGDRVIDGPLGPPIPIDPPIDRPGDRPDRDDHPSIWRRCLQAAHGDEVGDTTTEFRENCRRLLWKHNAWKRCAHWATEHTDLDIENRRELWRLCHRLVWNQQHAL